MKLYGHSGQIYIANSCQKPKRTNRSGRTWDSKNKSIDEVEREFHYDSTWGQYMYFMYNGVWYKTSLENAFSEGAFYTREDRFVAIDKKEEDRRNLSFHETIRAWNFLRFDEDVKDLPLEEMWRKLQSSKDGFFGNEVPLVESYKEFVSSIKTPNAAQKKIIAMFNGVYREKDLINE